MARPSRRSIRSDTRWPMRRSSSWPVTLARFPSACSSAPYIRQSRRPRTCQQPVRRSSSQPSSSPRSQES
eukprot:5173610-Pyramimonas_sp.AAC.1